MSSDPSISTEQCFRPEVCRTIASEIADAGGNEVFFFGTVADSVLTAVEVVARGHSSAVPVFLDRAQEHHHVLIHNHPGGDLTPSSADLSIASEAGMRGLGFFIVDDEAKRVYRVVEPHVRRELVPIDVDEIEGMFSSDGILAKAVPQFEDRPGQRAMAVEVARAFNDGSVTAFEAGTGVGKSFAYLVPSILWATANKSRVVVSTQTIALSEQLSTKDLPILSRVLDVEFDFALIKGRGNYACRRKAAEVVYQKDLYEGDEERGNWVEAILDRLSTSRTGSRSELDGVPPDDIWDDFRSSTDQSLKTRCPHYQECFYYNARREAARTQVLIVNHHLFFADLAVRMSVDSYDDDLVIPAYDRVVFDEAHRLEEIASQHLGGGFSRIGLYQMLGRMASARDRRGRFHFLSHAFRENALGEASKFLDRSLMAKVQDTRSSVGAAFDDFQARVAEATVARTRDGEVETMHRLGSGAEDLDPELIEEPLLLLRDELRDLQRTIRHAWNLLLDEPFEPEVRYEGCVAEYRSAFTTVGHAIESVESLLSRRKGFLSWVEFRRGRGRNVLLRSAPIRVSEILSDALYSRVSTAIMTSATLSVSESWDFLADRLGWYLTEKGRFRGEIFDSPFDFDRQSMLGIPDDLPSPEEPSFSGRFTEIVRESVLTSSGRAFVLFTSHSMLRKVSGALRADLEAQGYPCLVQGTQPQSELLRRFRDSGRAVLFGNQTFWEGVDVPGEALSCVIIARLPFRVPSHPLERARAEDLEARGKNPFSKLTVPQAVLALKQGFGRLIRTTTDRGAVIIADRRIVTKSYGRRFLESLPECRRAIGPWTDVHRELSDFFAAEETDV